jgi:hypothetical protein
MHFWQIEAGTQHQHADQRPGRFSVCTAPAPPLLLCYFTALLQGVAAADAAV